MTGVNIWVSEEKKSERMKKYKCLNSTFEKRKRSVMCIYLWSVFRLIMINGTRMRQDALVDGKSNLKILVYTTCLC